MKNKIYVVSMYRWGDRESHSYVQGVYTKKSLAIKLAEEERVYRGGNKYYPEVLEFNTNTPKSSEDAATYKIIVDLITRRYK